MDVVEFVLAELPPAPARVLEIGCGQGQLARAIAAAGYGVLAVDPEAPDGALFRRTTIEDLDDPGPFGAVVASRSLHHVHDLPAAVDKAADLLGAGGCVVLDEFGWERLDGRSAERVGISLEEWYEEHAHLHTSEEILRELDRRFSRRSFSWEPYLYRESRKIVSQDEERKLLAADAINAVGFRYVGTLHARGALIGSA
jgi:SAM-dependent methyltransferase